MAIRFISTKYHCIIDYLLGSYIACLPAMCKVALFAPPAKIGVAVGAGLIINNLFSTFELGWKKVMTGTMHLLIDGLPGLLLAFSPWLFHFEYPLYLPYLALGLFVVFIAVCTKQNKNIGSR